jgi:predicted dehydrogenase
MLRRTFLGTLAAGALVGVDAPLRLGMVGLVHGHASGFLSRFGTRKDVELVGFAETDGEVAARYAKRFRLDPATIHASVDEMLDRSKPQGVVVFTTTFDHLAVVEACAKRKLPVMMEKPLAVSVEHARGIERAANEARIPVLVNYETTWYSSMRAAWVYAKEMKALGDLRKVVVHAGHRGPKEIGVQPEFLAWLTDPKKAGGGALFDFGCYGANLMTWLMDDQRPISVTGVTQRIKPDVYPNTDDEATIILEYPHAQGVVQASWNWPFSRKDMEVYGRTGQVCTVELSGLRTRLEGQSEALVKPPAIPAPEDEFLGYFAAVVRGAVPPSGLSSLKNNLVVTEILDAARESAATGKAVRLC